MSKIRFGIVIFILFLGLILRLHNYDVYPQRGASSDEYTYTFLGVSLLTIHVPISWSYFSPYKNKYDLTINKLYFPMVYPYFDHPPLIGLFTGGLSILFGQDTFEEVDLKTIRLVPIFLSMISSIFVFLLGYRLYGYKTAIWALLIYSTTTIVVMNTRVVFAENLLTPLFLGVLYLFILWQKRLTDKKALLGVLTGLSFWTKEVGVIVFITLMFLLITKRIKTKYMLIVAIIFFSFFTAYLGYGAFFDWEVFTGAITVQASRIVGPQTLQLLTSTPIIVNKIYYDGWYFLGLICFFASFLDFRKHMMLLVSSAAYFMLLIFSLTREGEMGWYMIPLFPFMSLFTAHFLVEGLRRQWQSWFIFVLLIFVGLSQIKFLYEDNFGLSPPHFRVLLFLLFGPLLIPLIFKKERLFRIIGNTWFYLFILGNIFLTYNYTHPA